MESLLKTSSLEKISMQEYEFRWGFFLMDFYTKMKRVAVATVRKERPIKYGEEPSLASHLTVGGCDFDRFN